MGWGRRSRGMDFYKSIPPNGRGRKVYLGRRQEAETEARRVQERRQARQADQQERMQIAGAEQLLRELKMLADMAVWAVLHEAGYRQHRGEWRRPRQGKENKECR